MFSARAFLSRGTKLHENGILCARARVHARQDSVGCRNGYFTNLYHPPLLSSRRTRGKAVSKTRENAGIRRRAVSFRRYLSSRRMLVRGTTTDHNLCFLDVFQIRSRFASFTLLGADLFILRVRCRNLAHFLRRNSLDRIRPDLR